MIFYVPRELNKDLMNTIVDGFESFEMTELNDMIDSNLETLAGCEALTEISSAIADFGFDICGFEASNNVGAESRIKRAVKFIKDIIFKIVNYIKLYFNSYAKKLKKIKEELKELKIAIQAAQELGGDLPQTVKARLTIWRDKEKDTHYNSIKSVTRFLANCGSLKDYKIVTENKSSNDVLSETYTFIREVSKQLAISAGKDKSSIGDGANTENDRKVVTESFNELQTILKSDEVVKTANPDVVKRLKDIGLKPFVYIERASEELLSKAKLRTVDVPQELSTKEVLDTYLWGTEKLIEWLDNVTTNLSEEPVKVNLENKDEDITAYSKELLSYTKDILAKFRECYGRTAKAAFTFIKYFHSDTLDVLNQIKSNNND